MLPVRGQWELSDVIGLFTSGGGWSMDGDPSAWYEITDYLNQGLIEVAEERYEPVPEPTDALLAPYFEAAKRDSGRSKHHWLKWSAWNWLNSLGDETPVYEYSCCYGKADLALPRGRIFVECGNTRADKFVVMVQRFRKCAMVRYPYPEKTKGVSEYWRIILRPTSKLWYLIRKQRLAFDAGIAEKIRTRDVSWLRAR